MQAELQKFLSQISLPKMRLSKSRQDEVLDELEEAATPGFDFFLLVVLSCAIATFGLITDSAAVIIGAMLVAPLMSPILGVSLASVAGEEKMFQKSLVALGEGALLAITLSAFIGWSAIHLPLDVLLELPGEIVARTHPTPFDLGVALAGGAAAAYALAQPRISAALPGVAIATALMPPLCTVGIGLSIGDTSVSFGALLLFLTNLTAITFAGILVFFFVGFRPLNSRMVWGRLPQSLTVSAVLVLIITIPLVLLTLNFVADNRELREIRAAVQTEIIDFPDAQLVDVSVSETQELLSLKVTVRASGNPRYEEVVALQERIAGVLQRTISLQLIVIPTTHLDPLVPPTPTNTPTITLTPTPGPSLTPTQTPTHTPTITPSLTPSATPTITPSATNSPTPTLTYTPTPVLAYITGTGGVGVALRSEPGGGSIIGFIPEGAPINILYQKTIVDDKEWIEIRDILGRTGWVLTQFIVIRP